MRLLTTLLILGIAALSTWVLAQQKAFANVEDIYVVRSLRLSREKPTAYCTNGPVGIASATFEDHYQFLAITIGSSDSKVISANGKQVGSLHACLGPTSDPQVDRFTAQGTLGTTSFSGRGECRASKQDFPEAGITPYRCYLELTDISTGYVGGQLTSNTVFSRQLIGAESDPSGYVQPSIATVRLWKKR